MNTLLISGSTMKRQIAGIEYTKGAIRPRDLPCLNVLLIEP